MFGFDRSLKYFNLNVQKAQQGLYSLSTLSLSLSLVFTHTHTKQILQGDFICEDYYTLGLNELCGLTLLLFDVVMYSKLKFNHIFCMFTP